VSGCGLVPHFTSLFISLSVIEKQHLEVPEHSIFTALTMSGTRKEKTPQQITVGMGFGPMAIVAFGGLQLPSA